MIQRLFIRNYALIDSLEIDFRPGFTVLTGETGAGKSIILGALSLILGQRADSKAIKDAAQKTVIEGTFDVSAYEMRSFFEENDLDYEPSGICILRRELSPAGKSRAFVNDTPVSLTVLKELGEQLIDIHSQHQNLLLGDNRFQLRMIDIWAGDEVCFRNTGRNISAIVICAIRSIGCGGRVKKIVKKKTIFVFSMTSSARLAFNPENNLFWKTNRRCSPMQER